MLDKDHLEVRELLFDLLQCSAFLEVKWDLLPNWEEGVVHNFYNLVLRNYGSLSANRCKITNNLQKEKKRISWLTSIPAKYKDDIIKKVHREAR